MALPRVYVDLAARYGSQLDEIAAGYRNPVTGRPLSGAALIAKTIRGESAGEMDAVSHAGARGPGQFMPGTRKAVLDKTGGKVDPWRSPREAVQALVMHMRGELGHRKGLEGYNPGGGSSYVNYILGQRVGSVGGGGGGAPGGGGSQARGGGVTVDVPASGGQGLPMGSEGLTALVEALGARPQARASAGVAPPAHSAQAALPQGFQTPMSGGGPAPKPDTDALLEAVRTIGGDIPRAQVPGGQVTIGGQDPPRELGPGRLQPRPGGGYAGTQGIGQQLAQLGQRFDLKVMSTKRHNQNPFSGSNSDHDHSQKSSYAVDVSNGSQPTPQMDRYAFTVARSLGIRDYKRGTPINRSVVVDGYRYQIIYRGSGKAFGGNHMNHVHVGVRKV